MSPRIAAFRVHAHRHQDVMLGEDHSIQINDQQVHPAERDQNAARTPSNGI